MSEAKTIKEQIGFLIELQVVDGEIYALNREKNNIPRQIKAIEETLEAKKADIKQAKQDLKALQLKLKDEEVNLQQKEEEVKKLQIQLYQIKTNKEYSAMLTEIKGMKADNSLIEEEIIRLMDKIDVARKKVEEEEVSFKKREEETQGQKDIISKRSGEIDARLSELSAKRGNILPYLEKQILARYERVLKNRDGLAMARIENGACGGCHMNLPPQIISEAKLREDIVICGSCSRILYIDENAEIN